MQRQPVRGNPEEKINGVVTNFSGGVNLTYSDDLVGDFEMRWLENYDLDNRGEMRIRKGYGKNDALTQLIFNEEQTIEMFPIITKLSSPVTDILMFKLVEDTNNAWKFLSDFKTLAEYQATYGSLNNTIKLLIIGKLANGTTKYWIKKYVIGTSTITRTGSTGLLPFTIAGKDFLMNITTGEQYGKVFFTHNDKGMVCFNNATDTFTYYGAFGGVITNSSYKPSGIEVRKIGFNVLGTDPLSWIDSSGLTTESIQGVFLTTADRIPLSVVPAGTPFQVNIIYTGNENTFTITIAEVETELEATIAKNLTYSSTGIAVYDVEFKTQPSVECEFHITFTSELVTLTEYVDYYNVGQVDPKAKVVSAVNLGGYKVIQMYDRLVFYKGNEIWFSDINQFDYVPNFNYILLPLDTSDEVVKIAFFRTSYLVFTKKKIYKLNGSFDSNTLSLGIVNDDVGCIAPNSVCLVENEMYFLSTRGLRSLKTDVFRDGIDNLREFDDKLRPIIPTDPNAYAIAHKDQYLLFSNNRGNFKKVAIRDREYVIPDVIRQYYKTNAFAFDMYALNSYPRFMFFNNGEFYSFMGSQGVTNYDMVMFREGDDYKDFAVSYDAIFETSGLNMGYPLHEKKYKYVSFKFGGEASTKNIYAEIFGDGVPYHDTTLEPVPPSTSIEMNSSRYILTKERFPTKCRNISVAVTTDSALGMSLQSMSYIYKLGKVRKW